MWAEGGGERGDLCQAHIRQAGSEGGETCAEGGERGDLRQAYIRQAGSDAYLMPMRGWGERDGEGEGGRGREREREGEREEVASQVKPSQVKSSQVGPHRSDLI